MTYDPTTSAREKTPWGDFELKATHLKTKVIRWGPDRELTADEIHAAALTVCDRATDVHEARELLAMLDLLEVTP